MRQIELDQYQEDALETATFSQDIAVTYLALALPGEAGEVAEKVSKLIRDHGWMPGDPIPAGHREALVKELGDVLWYTAVLAQHVGVTLSEVATLNIEKLRSRQERGVLGGDGDNR